MSNIEIIDGNDIKADMTGSIMSRIKLAIARAQAYLEMGRTVHVKFTFNDSVTVTVAADSNSDLVYNTAAMQYRNPDRSASREVGPYPTQLTFDGDRAAKHQLIYRGACMAVQAYQLGEAGWVERVDADGEVYTNWYGLKTDWYVQSVDTAVVFLVPDAQFVRCPCPSHK